eukprot:6214351-Pleurochrysis_carterae.AAC.2
MVSPTLKSFVLPMHTVPLRDAVRINWAVCVAASRAGASAAAATAAHSRQSSRVAMLKVCVGDRASADLNRFIGGRDSAAMAGGGDGGSLGYAARLSYRRELGGGLGKPELSETAQALEAKLELLISLIRNAEHLVVFTGAGISTSAGIPDFRGPNGVWTAQSKGQPLPRAAVDFSEAVPSLTHQALLRLHQTGRLKYLVSQNVDCLHIRSGFPRRDLAELHGNCFAERCERCGIEYIRDFEVPSVGFKLTGRSCVCGGKLRDHCLDWDDALPEAELRRTETHCAEADLVLCLGTSLKITPACDLPFRALKPRKDKRGGGAVAIVNLQATPKDRRATIVVHAYVDVVMARVMRALQLDVPPFRRLSTLVVSHEVVRALGAAPRLCLSLSSVADDSCPIPWLREADACLCVCTESHADAAAHDDPVAEASSIADSVARMRLSPPSWRAELALPAAWEGRCVEALLTLSLARDDAPPAAPLRHRFSVAAAATRKRGRQSAQSFEVLTCLKEYNLDEHLGGTER